MAVDFGARARCMRATMGAAHPMRACYNGCGMPVARARRSAYAAGTPSASSPDGAVPMYVPPPGSTPGPMMDMRARLRPMGIGDILDETFRLYRENFTLFVATCAVLEVPVQIINFLILLSAPVAVPPTPGQPLTPGQFRALAAGSGASSIGGLIGAFAAAIITAALAVAISNRYLGRSITVGAAYRA